MDRNARGAREHIHIVAALSAAVTIGLLPITAQATTDYTPPEVTAKDPNGVDLGSGILTRSKTFLTVGDPAAGGLGWSFSGYWGHDNFEGRVVYQPLDASHPLSYTVSIGEKSTVFYQNCAATTCYSGAADDATMIKSGSNWIYTAHDGTVYTFDVNSSSNGKLLSIQYPNGYKTTLTYVTPTCASNCPLDNVISNAGFAVKFAYGASPTIKAVNLLAHSCDTAVNCSDGYDNVLTIGTFSTTGLNGFAYSGRSIADALGNITLLQTEDISTYQDGVVIGLIFFQSPTGVQTAAVYDSFSRVKTITTQIGAWNYSYSDGNITAVQLTGPHTVTLKDPSNTTILTVVAAKVYPHVSNSTDALSRTTTYHWAGGIRPGTSNNYYYMPAGSTLPEGNSSTYAYDARGNVTSVTRVGKSTAPALTSTSITAGYPSTCTYPKTCNQPTWTKDAKGNQTDYTYDNTHGGVLTVTLPVDNNGLRLRTYNTYTAFDTGNGIIYRLTRSDTCGLTSAQLTLTACPTESNGATAAMAMMTSIKMIDYGNATSAPYTYKSSLPYTVTNRDGRVTAPDLQTTTYAYDKIGNVVSVDGPLVGTVDQSLTTYDANRRKIYEIGPIPGGTGSQYRSLIRHTYNGDGQETQTAVGYANSNLTNGSDAVYTSYNRMTYDTAGRLIKKEVISQDVVVP